MGGHERLSTVAPEDAEKKPRQSHKDAWGRFFSIIIVQTSSNPRGFATFARIKALWLQCCGVAVRPYICLCRARIGRGGILKILELQNDKLSTF